MVQAQYPYLDLTVLPEVRGHVIASNAAILFDRDMARILWANGEAAGFIGSPTLRMALEGDFQLNPAMVRQIRTAVDRLDHEQSSSAIMRVRRGFKTQLVGFAVTEIKLPDGAKGLLLTTESLHGRGHSQADMARVAVECLDGYSHASAIVDGNGGVVAASTHFSELAVSTDDLADMARVGNREDDRLVKRPLLAGSHSIPSGLARLSDDPLMHLLVIANPDAMTDAPSDPVSDGRSDTAQSMADAAAAAKTQLDEGTSADLEEEAPSPAVGAFSNKRSSTSGAGRWYYKANIQQASNGEAPADEDGDEISDIEAQDTLGEDSETSGAELVQVTHQNTDVPAAPDGSEQAQPVVDPTANDEFRATGESSPVRFVWEMDTDQIFRSVSPEFARVVGEKSAQIEGLGWSQVSQSRGLTNGHEIGSLLEKGDTWSGKTVLWPVEGTDLRVPVDLAGLPTFGRNREFAGFNGFGIVRMADAMVDPQGAAFDFDQPADGPGLDEDESGNRDGLAAPVGFIVPGSAHADMDTPADQPLDEAAEENGNVVDLRRLRDERTGDQNQQRSLSNDEKEAFEEIGEKLADEQTSDAAPDDSGSKDAAGSKSKETDRDVDSEPEQAFIPSAFAGSRRRSARDHLHDRDGNAIGSHDVADNDVTTDKKILTPDHDVDTSILARLPIPVLVYRDNELLFGNEEFFSLTGYEHLAELADAGGVEALFGEQLADEHGADLRIIHCDGDELDVRAHVQRVPWDEDKAMLLTLRSDPDADDGDDDDDGARLFDAPDAHEPTDSAQDSSPGATTGSGRGSPEMRVVRGGRDGGTVPSQSESVEPFGGLGAEDLRNILDTATDGVIILSDEGVVKAINRSAEALFDVDADDIAGRSLTRFLAPESHRVAMDYLSGISGTGVASLLNDGREVIGKTAKGGLLPLFMTIGKLEKTNGCCAVMRDITHWKKAEEELLSAKAVAERASEQKTEFLAKVSHEVRTPLNAIIGFSDMMIEERFGKIDNDRYRGYLRDIQKSGSHVLDLINDLLDISKIEAGKMELAFDACDLNTVVSETVAMTQPDANKERVIIRTSLSTVVPKVVADLRSLKQIILNLVSNSIKYTKSGGQVIVSTVYDESGEVVLRVRDTGIGMSEDELETALRPFEQISTSSSVNKQGTGLGLPLTKAMVEANRASFHIESKPDDGTLVEVHFPPQRVLADR